MCEIEYTPFYVHGRVNVILKLKWTFLGCPVTIWVFSCYELKRRKSIVAMPHSKHQMKLFKLYLTEIVKFISKKYF